MRGKKDWLLVYPSIEYVVECVLEHKSRRSGHIKKSISFLDCRVKHLEDRPQCFPNVVVAESVYHVLTPAQT